ncbi:MAG: 2-hydroxyacyl-CoA dehydratase, partial [Oscillospiraceae bacterium]|nr:2-hydroxyacyl-CoA dehydratase [Oscillospiraceae bacterium]
ALGMESIPSESECYPAKLALESRAPVDLGTRCTVFMNSNVKQAQKEGAGIEDISAGLAYSVIKNALFKVIKMTDAADLGSHVVVQGGTFYNEAVLRALEKVSGAQVTCPDISGIMGAFGAALLARERYEGQPTAMPALTELLKLEYTSRTTRCGGCANHCMLTVNHFPTGRHNTGNRCEKGLGAESARKEKAPNLYAYKLKRMFDYAPLPLADAPRGEIGIPRVLNMYERYPFWAVFFRRLGFRTVLSPLSRRSIYELGMESIPSESECYPAKLAHGHVQWLIDQGVKSIFHPCVYYEQQETDEAQNHYNCPIVISYAENLKNNVEAVSEGDVRYLRPFMAFTNEKVVTDRLIRFCHDEWGISSHEVRVAAHEAWLEQQRVRDDIRAEGRRALEWMRAGNRRGIVLAGRPYHIDPEINHGIPELITSYGLAVLSEDSLDEQFTPVRPVRVNDQWVYHSRLYTAAQFVCKNEDLELIQLNSFGCGLDAVTTDQIAEILEQSGKLYTCLKIDEISNLGAVRIRLRSLLAAMNMRRKKGLAAHEQTAAYRRVEYSAAMQRAGYTILCPQMSPIHFNILEPIFRANGYNLEVLDNDNRTAIDTGLKFVNNDACFPSITVVGQIMEAVLSGRHDTSRLAIIMSQTGGCCRASNYIAFIRRALSKVGQGHIPVISLNANGMETNEGFRLSKNLLLSSIRGIVCGDLLMRCLYRMRPYELTPGSANALHKLWERRCIESLTAKDKPAYSYKQLCRGIVEDFDALPIDESVKKPRVGIVGEILVKFLPLANNHLVELLEREGAEAVVPDLLSFFSNSFYGRDYLHKYLGTPLRDSLVAFGGVTLIEHFQKPGVEALRRSKHFDAPLPIKQIASFAKPFLSI